MVRTVYRDLKRSVQEWMEKGSTIANNDSCPLCEAGEDAHRMDYNTRDIRCLSCESEWEFTGEKSDKNGFRMYELVSCPEQPERKGNVRNGFEWSQMENDMGSDGIYESTPRFQIDEDANPLFTFSLGLLLTGFSFPVMGTVLLFPIGVLMLLAGPFFLLFGLIQWFYKPVED